MLLRNGIGEPIPILVDQRFSGGFPLSEMTVDDFRRSFDGRSSANRGMQRSGAASSGPIAEAATTLTADDILLLADGPAGPHSVEPPVLGEDGKVLFREGFRMPARRERWTR
jgi:hypothetical protein